MDTAEVLIVGAGPAGLSAAIKLASEGRSVILFEKHSQVGGQAGTSARIENMLPFSAGISGEEFRVEARAQCLKFGVQIEESTEATLLVPGCGAFSLYTTHGVYQGRVVLLALGLQNCWLGVPGEDLPGVHHGMRMDALADVAYRHVVLVGGGNSVGQAAVHYLDRGAWVTIIARRPLRETMSHYLITRITGRTSVVIDEIVEFEESEPYIEVLLKDAPRPLYVSCVHIFIGQQPGTEWLEGMIVLDDRGFIVTGEQYQTSMPGVFAVGDVTHDAVRSASCAIGDGTRVVPAIHKHLDNRDQQCYRIT